MPTIRTADGCELFYNDWGSGRPVVLIHGWPLNSDMWCNQSVFLAENGLRVIAYDRRGFGRSGQPWSGYDYDTLADDLAAVMDGLDLNDAALVGFSMGGGEVARYLGRHGSARVAKAVLISAVPPFLLKTPDNPGGVDGPVFEGILAGLRADRAHFMAQFGKVFYADGVWDRKVLDMADKPVSDETLAWSLGMATQASLRATLECVRAFSSTDFRADLAQFDKPTLLIHGTADKTVPIEVSSSLAAKLIPGARLIAYEDEPHGLFITAKDRLNADLLDFIAAP